MSAHQVDPVSGAHLIGGEMLQWSDLDRTALGAAAATLVRSLAAADGIRRVLALGPRASRVIDALPIKVEVDVLVRGLPDARTISTTARMRHGVNVLCGGLDRFEADAPYDLVIAFDGPAVLLGPDSQGLGHEELLLRMAKWLSPEGTLVATVENDLGLDRLLRLQVRDLYDADTAWHRGGPGFAERPPYFRELVSALSSADLRADDIYAAYPSAEDVTLLIGREATDDVALSLTAAALTARAEGGYFSDHPALADPYNLALRVFDSGLALELASAWVVVARPSSAPARRNGGPDAGAAAGVLPVLIASEQAGRPEWRAVTTIEHSPDGWTYRLRPLVAAEEMRERRLIRDFSRLAHVPGGGLTLEMALRSACAVGDLGRVRHLVKRYHAWLQSEVVDIDRGDGRFFAVPANLLLATGALLPLDASWRLSQELPSDVLLVRGLRDFVIRLLGSGAEHPWAADISPDALTQTLAAMVAVDDAPRLVDIVARVEAEVEVVILGGSAAAEATAYARNVAHGASQFAAQAGPSRGYREALASAGRMAQELHDREGQVRWLQATLRTRDRRVGELEHQVASVRGSVSFRIGRFFTWPGRALIGGARRVAISAIPAGYIGRAKNVLQRLLART